MKVAKDQQFIHTATLDWEDLGGGLRRKVVAHGEDLMAVVVEFKKGGIGALHHHPHRQVAMVLEGSFRVTIGERTETLRKGDLYYVPRDLVHGVTALEDGALMDVFTPVRDDFIPKA